MFTLNFDTGNAAFCGDGDDENINVYNMHSECSRILHDVAAKVAVGRTEGSIADINGNKIGYFKLDANE